MPAHMNATTPVDSETVKLTQFAHGGGCGCKIAPSLLRDILARAPQGIAPPELLVGTETADDAAVDRLNDPQALVTTTNFFTPHRRRPMRFWSHRRDQRAVRHLRHGRHAHPGAGGGEGH